MSWGSVEGLSPPSNVTPEFEHWFAQVVAEFKQISDAIDDITLSAAGDLDDLSDVTSAAVTDKYVLVANGSAYVGRALLASDISAETFADGRISQTSVTQWQGNLSIAWSQLTAVPSTFAPSAHTHGLADLLGFGAAGGYLRSTGTAWARVSGVAWGDLTSVPSTFTPSSHTHPTSDLTGWPANASGALVNNGSGVLSWGTVTPSAHTHPASEITAGTFGAGAYIFPSTLQINGSFLRVGTNPALEGALRVPNGVANGLYARNAANTNSLPLIYLSSGNIVVVSEAGVATNVSGALTVSGGDIEALAGDVIANGTGGAGTPSTWVLNDLTDVSISVPVEGQGLLFSGGFWVNAATFAPSAHTHALADLLGFGAAAGYLRSTGTAWARVSGVAWGDLTGVPATFAPSAHTHGLADLLGFGAAAGYLRSTGTAWARVSGVAAADITPGTFGGPGNYTFPADVEALGDVIANSVGGAGTPATWVLNDLTDVSISVPAEGHGLIYQSGFWVNAATFAPSAHTHALADLLGFGAAGGYLRSTGTAWARVSGVAWADLTGVPTSLSNTVNLTGNQTVAGIKTFTNDVRVYLSGGLTVLNRYLRLDLAANSSMWDWRIGASGELDLRSVTDAGATLFRSLWVSHTTGRVTFDQGIAWVGDLASGNVPAPRVSSGTFGSGAFAFQGGITIGGTLNHTTVATRDKYRLWNSDLYTIGFQNAVTFGGLSNDYAMTFQMNNNANRGFWWGDDAHTTAQGAMALTTTGRLTVALSLRVGFGEADVTSPSATALIESAGGFRGGNGTQALPAYAFTSNPDTGLYAYGAYLGVSVNNYRTLTLREISPFVEINCNGNEALRIIHGVGTGSPYISFYQTGATRVAYIQYEDGSNTLRLANDLSGPINPQTGGDEVLRMTHTNAAGSPYISFYQASTRRAYIQFSNAESSVRYDLTTTAHTHRFRTGGVTRFTIRSTDVESAGDVIANV